MASVEAADTESLDPREGGAGDGLPAGALVLGKYRVERAIGRGGMGAVYEATHTTLGSRVALKLPLGHSASASSAARLLREAQVAASLDPERVVRVIDVGVLEDGRPLIVLERLDGQTLAERLGDGPPLTVVEAVDLAIGACLGLVEAHLRAIVHRDIKPSNLFLAHRRDGSTIVKILDFGVAALRASGETRDIKLTDSHTPVGSPPYMAPEQLRGRDVDARTDVWGLGVTLFELLTNSRPFEGPTAAAMAAAIVADAPVQIASLRSDVPEALARIVTSCLQKDKADRPGDALALAQRLSGFASSAARAQVAATARATNESRPLVASSTRLSAAPRTPSSPTAPGASSDASASSSRQWSRALFPALALTALGAIWLMARGPAGAPAKEPSHDEPVAAVTTAHAQAATAADPLLPSRQVVSGTTESVMTTASSSAAKSSSARAVSARPAAAVVPRASAGAAAEPAGPPAAGIMDARKF